MQFLRLFFILWFLHSAVLFAQNEDFFRYRQTETIITNYIKKAAGAAYDTERLAYNDSIAALFTKILNEPSSFGFPFDSLRSIGKIVAPDKTFRIINWNIPFTDGTYQYRSFLQIMDAKNGQVKVFVLNDQSAETVNAENSVLSSSKWYGALYYKILVNKVDNRTYYTMLGLRYHDLFVSRKVIEVLYFDQYGNPVFGAPVIQDGNKIKHRVVFNFSARVGMILQYSDELSMIVCDHLAPSESKYTGQYDYYGPDFSYDGYQFLNGKWVLKTNIDLKNPEATKPPAVKRNPASNRISPGR